MLKLYLIIFVILFSPVNYTCNKAIQDYNPFLDDEGCDEKQKLNNLIYSKKNYFYDIQRLKEITFNQLENNETVQINVYSDSCPDLSFFSGDGTKENPFLLQNLVINHLNIQQTTKHFIIQNNTFQYHENAQSYLTKLSMITQGSVTIKECYYTGYDVPLSIHSFNGFFNFQNNYLTGNNIWISAHSSQNLVFEDNTIFESNSTRIPKSGGIVFSSIENSIIRNNIITKDLSLVENNVLHKDNGLGISIESSTNITVNNNRLLDCNFGLVGSSELFYTSNTFFNNTVNNLKVEFIIKQKDVELSGSYGQLLIFYSQNVDIFKLENTNQNVGLVIAYSSDIKIRENTFSNTKFKQLDIKYSSKIQIYNNVFSNCTESALVISSSTTAYYFISNNTFNSNYIALEISSINSLHTNNYMTITYNNFTYSELYAIAISHSFAQIYHNNFFYNNKTGGSQCYVKGSSESIQFYNTQSAIGNYWSDYKGNPPYHVYTYRELSGDENSIYDLFPSDKVLAHFRGKFIPPWEETTKTTSNQFLPIIFTILPIYILEKRKCKKFAKI